MSIFFTCVLKAKGAIVVTAYKMFEKKLIILIVRLMFNDSSCYRGAAPERPGFCARSPPERDCEALFVHPTAQPLQKNMTAITNCTVK